MVPCRGKQHRFPLLLARKHRQRIAVDTAHLVESPCQLALPAQRCGQQREHLRPVALPVHHAAADGGLTGIFVLLAFSDGAGSSLAAGSTTASGYSLRIRRTSGSADSRIEKMCSGPARKSSMALFWIATVEYSRQARCFSVAFRWLRTNPVTSPSQCIAATTSR